MATAIHFSSDITETVDNYAIDRIGGIDTYIVDANVTIRGEVVGGARIGEFETLRVEGDIYGQDRGIFLDPNGINHGHVTVSIGYDGSVSGDRGIVSHSRYNSITNYGTITSSHTSLDTTEGDLTIVNNGLIKSDFGATIVTTGSVSITNRGTIEAETYAIFGGRYQETVSNLGKIYGTVRLEGGNDTFISTNGYLYGTINAGAGDDTVYGGRTHDVLRGDAGNDKLYGNLGNDKLYGMTGNDTIVGGDGYDSLFGAQGLDKLTGGLGADVFVFNAALNAVSNVDTITDFSRAERDKIHLENAIFGKLVATGVLDRDFFTANADGVAKDANDYIIYETDTGKLFYDSNGDRAGGLIQFALISTKFPLVASDFFII